MYPAANAVLCRLTGLHPLVVTKVILCMMTVVLSYLVYAQIGKALLKEKQMVWVLLCFISVVNLNFHTIFSLKFCIIVMSGAYFPPGCFTFFNDICYERSH